MVDNLDKQNIKNNKTTGVFGVFFRGLKVRKWQLSFTRPETNIALK